MDFSPGHITHLSLAPNTSLSLSQGKLQVPHSIAIDTCENALYVADRGASSIRRFQITGDFAGETVETEG